MQDRDRLNQKRRYLASHLGGGEPAQNRLDKIDSLVDEQIREAQKKGAFDNLPGAGKPLPKDPAEAAAGDHWMSHRALKQAGFVPEWIRLRNEITSERGAVQAALQSCRQATADNDQSGSPEHLARLEQHYVHLATAINRKIDEHNVRCPPGQTLTRFVEDAVQRWK